MGRALKHCVCWITKAYQIFYFNVQYRIHTTIQYDCFSFLSLFFFVIAVVIFYVVFFVLFSLTNTVIKRKVLTAWWISHPLELENYDRKSMENYMLCRRWGVSYRGAMERESWKCERAFNLLCIVIWIFSKGLLQLFHNFHPVMIVTHCGLWTANGLLSIFIRTFFVWHQPTFDFDGCLTIEVEETKIK